MGSKKQNNVKRQRNPKPLSPNKKSKKPLSQPSSPPKHKNADSKRIKIDPQPSPIPQTVQLEPEATGLPGGPSFRTINKKLYTCTGIEAFQYFKDDPSLYNLYYAGYQEKMTEWPEQPVDVFVKWIKERSPALVVADFGCGDARLAKNVRNKVFSFDLVSIDPSVIECDMSNAPLISSSIDVAVFSLSLMGTDFPCYLWEAERVLKPSGWLLIAEVKNRFDPDPDRFLKAVCELGFISVSKDFSNKTFVFFIFKKKEKKRSEEKEIEWPVLKPCLFKRR